MQNTNEAGTAAPSSFENIVSGERLDIGGESLIGTGDAETLLGRAKAYAEENAIPVRARIDGRVYDFAPPERGDQSPAEATGEANSVIDHFSDRQLRVAVIATDQAGREIPAWEDVDRQALEDLAAEAESPQHLAYLIREQLKAEAKARNCRISACLDGLNHEQFKPSDKPLVWQADI